MGNQVNAEHFYRMLADVAPFMCTDDTYKSLNTVRIETIGDHMVAVTTDRYTMAVGRAEYNGEPLALTLSRADVVDFLKTAKSWCMPPRGWRGDPLMLSLDVRNLARRDYRYGSGQALGVEFPNGQTMLLEHLVIDFPAWRNLLPLDRAFTLTDDMPVQMSIQLLAKLTKTVSGKKNDMAFHFLERQRGQKSSPWIVARVGADLQVLIVGKESDQGAEVWTEWMWTVVETS
ncbi:hypothetical protein IU485_27880 [Nocardia cyriacigeorgica]|uniref:hypothetical protein n=1 Tax=Nocardia cyriacigeorgica TaxID=135487 RepID=UPI00189356A2|nr:hypothetical protein [Nocardia cyriacigeorgica]MBF6085198.1 hypothetical protein [Nocardia cyriacigeorgica]